MDSNYSFMPLAAVLVSLVASILIVMSGKRPNLREFWTFLAAITKFGIVISLLPMVLLGNYPQISLLDISPGISLALKVDMAGIIFALSASLLWILTSAYSVGYERGLGEHKQTRYFASFAVCVSATIGIAFAANLFTFVVFYEILTIATYPLVIHKETPEAIAAGRKYLVYLLTGGVAVLFALALTYNLAGTLDFVPGGFLTLEMGKGLLIAVFVAFLVGFGFKSALMPLHSWLPAAMAAPTPVSGLLHAVAVVKAGVFGFVRAFGFVIGPDLLQKIGAANVVASIAGFTVVTASLLAFKQGNLKKRLAYSTIGHLAYIVLGVSLFSPDAWTGSLLHIVNHAAMKITLFFCAGAIYVRVHKTEINELDGIGRQMPITMAAFAIASIGLAGIPPVGGFISKWYLVSGAVDSGQYIFTAVYLLSGLFNAAYFFPIVIRAFFRRSEKYTKFGEASMWMVIPLVITALLAVALGLFPDIFFHFAELSSGAAKSIFAGGGF
ncbi:monovalent cation/H+ antiporter subunit D family protein [Chloroflexota bacterium]